jgi:alkaline phosphatase D
MGLSMEDRAPDQTVTPATRPTRRKVLRAFAIPLLGAPAFVRAQSARPKIDWGVQSGDPHATSATIWSRTDRPSRLIVDWSRSQNMSGAIRVEGPAALDVTDFTARLELENLPSGADLFYRARFVSLADGKTESEPVLGRLRTAPGFVASGSAQGSRRNIKFAWSGDTVGQGYGINPDWGGMRCYETIRATAPDFFIHSGDTIYADGPLVPEVRFPDGTVWKNIVTEAKSRVAESLDDFRGCHQYNLLDVNVRRFNAQVPQIWQWDDHEVMNNWSPSKDLSAYREKSIYTLAARANRAFLEYAPMRWSTANQNRVYRYLPYGPLLDVFVIDLRSYRGPNTYNRQETEGPETAWFGAEQFKWLEAGLKASKARWKVIACDMPIGVTVPDGKDSQGRPQWEAFANGDGPALGRELELARLLKSLKANRVSNVVWLTADVHYTAAHYFDPAKAKFTDFDPFWEFISGPLNAGTFGPSDVDNTFGPQVMYQKTPLKGQANLPPSAGMQFFGEVEIDGRTEAMTVKLRDLAGSVLYAKTLAPRV